jgi:branched-subunit amino acid transport protein
MDGTRIGIILMMGLLAYAVRALPQVLSVGRKFPESWDRFLRYLSYALICSIISTTLFTTGARFEIQAAPLRALALITAVVVAYGTKSAVTGMMVGTVVVLLLSSLC